ncbi:uncharacterized protein LOC9659060 [Selaginella moellendorffii]|uniref:uncharacterized protein LOC9659060 n=1 Tax=Selaginella moellendorffii TaxID=88036 RepID=UPI000D1C9035|nr:uncharacterized protein LOC9659060 [Selaginella moellendorffii]|eukprot:XP_002965246.2 uncharacterized protein LOC9659060 [Selaginella moellendorffii]
MGLSLAVGIPAALILAVGAALLGVVSNRIFLLPLLHTSLIGFTVALFSHPRIDNPRILAKSSRGSFPIWSSFLFYPYLAGTRLYVRFRRRAGLEATYTEVCDGLFVGAWPFQREHIPPGNPAILDCTNELPRTVGLELPYLCVPAWDTRALSPESIELAVRWALVQRSQSHPVFIHCAKGHGRSVAVMCALLVALGVVDDWKEGESLIKRHRPKISVNSAHRKSLQEWQRARS